MRLGGDLSFYTDLVAEKRSGIFNLVEHLINPCTNLIDEILHHHPDDIQTNKNTTRIVYRNIMKYLP